MRVLITGGAGFIGSHIVDQLLANSHQPFVVDNLVSGSPENLPAGVPLFEVDICDTDKLTEVFEEVRPEWVCHQAAQMSVSRSVREPVFDAQINVLGLLQVFDLSVRHGATRITFASSGGVLYGDVFEPTDENHACEPVSPYGISKWVGEQYLKFYVREYGIGAVALRYANVYGPRQNPHGEAGVVAIFAQKMLAAEPTTINGDGKYMRDYVYVEDVARANVNALEAKLSDGFVALNIGTGLGNDVNQLATRMRSLCEEERQKKGVEEAIPEPGYGEARAGDLRSSLISARQAHKVLGWEPTVDFNEGLRRTAAWFAEKSASLS